MATYNADNERIKHQYFRYLKGAKGRNEASIDVVAKALDRFETYTGFRDFKQFHIEQAIGFRAYLSEPLSVRSGTGLSVATLHSTFAALKAFFQWLSERPAYRSRIRYHDTEYFSLSEKETRIARTRREPRVPTIDQILHVLRSMPTDRETERRNRALIAFTLLTGIRHRALASLTIKHVDLNRGAVIQDAREVATKFSKTFTTIFFPVEPEGWVPRIVAEWIEYLLKVKLWSGDDPLFPATRVEIGVGRQFEAMGLEARHWRSAEPIATIFKQAFEEAGLSYFNPHSFRKTLVLLGQQRCRTPEEFKAWSQNLGHEHVLTTFSSYGQIAAARQADIIRALGTPQRTESAALEQIAQVLRSAGHGAT